MFLIAGPCVIETEKESLEVAAKLKDVCDTFDIPFVFKSSFHKANRTSLTSYTGVGMAEGLRILNKVREEVGCKILTDVHEFTPLDEVADVVDILQTPAYLCRQTDFLMEVGRQGRPVNIKKGQFLSPYSMHQVVTKIKAVGNTDIMVCERGTMFGYGDLVVDMRGLVAMRDTGCPVVFDATHSVQKPATTGIDSGGVRGYVRPLARAAVAVGVDGLFMETTFEPDKALCDGPNMLPTSEMYDTISELLDINDARKEKSNGVPDYIRG